VCDGHDCHRSRVVIDLFNTNRWHERNGNVTMFAVCMWSVGAWRWSVPSMQGSLLCGGAIFFVQLQS